MELFHGIGVSPGIAEGTVHLLETGSISIPKYWLHDSEIEVETNRYRQAHHTAKEELEKLKNKIAQLSSGDHLHILEGHLAMLDDILLREEVVKIIQSEKINAEWALMKIQRRILDQFSKIDEEYFKERQTDVVHVIERIQQNLLGGPEDRTPTLDRPVILVAHDLSPADLAQLHRSQIMGFITDVGGRTSHTGIVAASLEIPAVVGTENLSEQVKSGDRIIVDGIHGVVILNPTEKTSIEYEALKQEYIRIEEELIAERNLPAETEDHQPVALTANMEFHEEIPFIQSHGAMGIGLYRTEFLFLNQEDIPSEEVQFEYYKKILEDFSPLPVTMRTYDLGGDKGGTPSDILSEENPALGLRAIRYCLQQPELFRTQLRAMLRASVYGNLKIMLPMISGISEIQESKQILEEIKLELKNAGVPFQDPIELGIMIETPSAALTADILAQEVDFFSVGTNDLIQYTLAVDRVNEHVAYLYNPMHPAILRMLEQVCQVGREYQIPVHLCGEMASDPVFLPILISLGFDELSMNAVVLPRVKHILRGLRTEECHRIFSAVKSCKTDMEGLQLLHQEMHEHFPEYIELWEPADSK